MSKVIVTLRNPLDFTDQIEYYIIPNDTALAKDWITALKRVLIKKNLLEKNFCFLGFPHSARNIEYLCKCLQDAVDTINTFFDDYKIEEIYSPETVRVGLDTNHELLNKLHNHFEVLQGTVEHTSTYFTRGDYKTKYAIRQLNIICHELESLIQSIKELELKSGWVRPSQITTFLHAERYPLKGEHRYGFITNGYNRHFGTVYMHWAQIGKTLMEVWKDEGAPDLDETTCEAITHLKYYSGEFDIDWGPDYGRCMGLKEVDDDMYNFKAWLIKNNLNPRDTNLSLGYLPIGKVDIEASFNTTDKEEIWKILGKHLDIISIEVDGIKNSYPYCWSDSDHIEKQIEAMKPGYDATISNQ